MSNPNQTTSQPFKVDNTRPVMVTGATGYVAGWLVKKLLEEGVTVHAPVRDPNNAEKLKYLNKIANESPGEIKFFQADLLESGSYAEAMAGCPIVFHTASPFALSVKDPQTELIEPALQGTINILEEVNRTECVERVVLTSSLTAVYSDAVDLKETPNGILTEEEWNKNSSLDHNPYFFSKRLAEQEAWKICKKQSRWTLVTINPSLVIGPGINPFATSESYKIISAMGDGTNKSGTPNFPFGVVDVREVAEAHMAAAYLPEAHGRHIISAKVTSFPEVAAMLFEKYGADYPIPNRVLPKTLVWLLGPLIDKSVTRKMIGRNVNLPVKIDNSKGIRELGLSYRPLHESVNEMFQQMIENGYFQPA